MAPSGSSSLLLLLLVKITFFFRFPFLSSSTPSKTSLYLRGIRRGVAVLYILWLACRLNCCIAACGKSGRADGGWTISTRNVISPIAIANNHWPSSCCWLWEATKAIQLEGNYLFTAIWGSLLAFKDFTSEWRKWKVGGNGDPCDLIRQHHQSHHQAPPR